MIKIVKHLGGAVTIDGVPFDNAITKITGNKIDIIAEKVVQPSGRVVQTAITSNTYALFTEK